MGEGAEEEVGQELYSSFPTSVKSATFFKMLKHLQLQYRSFQNADFANMSEISVFIGPNNAGKSSIFQALHGISEYFQGFYKKSPDEAYGFEPWKNYGKISVVNRLLENQASRGKNRQLSSHKMLAITFSAQDLGITNYPEVDLGIQFIFNTKVSYPSYNIIDSPAARFPEALVQSAEVLGYKGGEIWGESKASLSLQRIIEPRLKHSTPEIPDIAKEVRQKVVDFFRGIYFLSHRRASLWEREVSASEKLDSQAQDLASRIDQLIVEDAHFRARLNRFMNTVLPSLGHIAPVRSSSSQDGRNPTVSIYFENGQGERIPLQDSGGGVEQVLAIATVLLGEPKATLLLIEEPESHLQEEAQRRLIQQIFEHRGERQIIISTHSPVFMNGFPSATVYQITKPQDESLVEKCLNLTQQHRILDLLGAQPSTLLQSNLIICIEGPTELILLRHWIKLMAPSLREQEHFLFQMTAGSLLTHYSIDSEKEELIHLLSMCRNVLLLCDKDSHEKPAVTRLIAELKKKGLEDSLLITDYYEIEWYYPKKGVEQLWELSEETTNRLFTESNRQRPFFDVLLEVGKDEAKLKTAARRKPEWAKKITADPTLTREDWFGPEENNLLAQKVGKLVNLIRKANQIS